MRIRRGLVIALIIALVFSLCGCELFPVNTDELLKPPALTGESAPIEDALRSAVKGYTLRYPSLGDYRSAFVMNDLDGDGKDEVLAFYSLSDDEMHVHLILHGKKNKWYSADDQIVTAGDVERVAFHDLDGDGIKEVLIGWEVLPATEKQLAVYRYHNKKLNPLQPVPYTEFSPCDPDNDGNTEIYVQLINQNEAVNSATFYRLYNGKLTNIGQCRMDGHVKSVAGISEVRLPNGTSALYVDELKSSGAITEILLFQGGKPVNPLLDPATAENTKTVRATSLLCEDINNDGLPEIPIAGEIPAIDPQTAEKAYYTRWCSFDGAALKTVKTVIVNQMDGYSLSVPESWIGQIGVERDGEKHARIFFACDATGAVMARLFELRAYPAEEWDKEPPDGFFVCNRSEKTVVAGRIFTIEHPLAVTEQTIRKMITMNE